MLSRGKVILDKGTYVGRPGDGHFVKRGPYGGPFAPTLASEAGPQETGPGVARKMAAE